MQELEVQALGTCLHVFVTWSLAMSASESQEELVAAGQQGWWLKIGCWWQLSGCRVPGIPRRYVTSAAVPVHAQLQTGFTGPSGQGNA